MVLYSVRLSFTVKRHHDHSNSHNVKHLVGAAHLELIASVHYRHGGIWCAGRHGIGEGAQFSTSCRQQEVVLVSP